MTDDLRPTRLTLEMALRAAMATAKDVAEEGLIDKPEIEAHAKDIAKYGSPNMDGYDLAKTLDERCYWDCNLAMAEALDGFSSYARHEIEAAQKEWAARVNLVPAFPVGAKVKLRRGETGEVTGIYERGPAQYLVAIDGDPHNAPPANSRRIVNFEDATAA